MREHLCGIAVGLLIVGTAPAVAQSTAVSPDCIYDNDQSYRIATPTEVHTGPARTRRIIYDLPANARAIRCVGPCRDAWCRIRWQGVVGWVPRQNLIPDGRVNWTTKPYE